MTRNIYKSLIGLERGADGGFLNSIEQNVTCDGRNLTPRWLIHFLCRSTIARMGEEDSMKRRHDTPEEIVRKLREADRLLGEGIFLVEVCKHLEVTAATYYRW
jgi:hypothetical protein